LAALNLTEFLAGTENLAAVGFEGLIAMRAARVLLIEKHQEKVEWVSGDQISELRAQSQRCWCVGGSEGKGLVAGMVGN
jgi:hypothetical protein